MIIKRTALGFSLRSFVSRDLNEVRAIVEGALSCKFHRAAREGVDVWLAEALGMRLALAVAPGREGKLTYQLHGFVDDVRYLDCPPGDEVQVEQMDIGVAIADLLWVHGAGYWWPASEEDQEAEIAHAREEDGREREDDL
jgi:hypothetical protein